MQPLDWLTLALVSVAILAVALLVSVSPALRVMRLDLTRHLRED